MADPNWNRGFYYDGVPPHNGMKLARQIATITYRSGPEWEQRFGRRMLSEKEGDVPRLSPDFLIETYLDHQVSTVLCLEPDGSRHKQPQLDPRHVKLMHSRASVFA